MTPEYRYWYNGKMIKVGQLDFFTDGTIHVNGELVGGKLMMWTGLIDKNGLRIYEGDILKWTALDQGVTITEISEVMFISGIFCRVVGKGEYTDALVDRPDFSDTLEEEEIIGNIYENPELLNEETK